MSLSMLLRCNDLDQTRDCYRNMLHFTATDTAESTLTAQLQGMPYGSRKFGIEDCNGYYLAFSQG